MELVLEQTQQGTSYEVSISAEGVEELKRKVKIKGEKKEALLTLRQKPEHQSDTQVITMKMEILLEPTSNKLMVDPPGFEGYLKMEVKASFPKAHGKPMQAKALTGHRRYFQKPIDPMDQEKTTFTCPFGTYAYTRMPFSLCNAPATFQRCMLAIFHDMIEESVEVFMDDFSLFGNSFDNCLNNLDKMLQCLEVDKAKIDIISKLSPHTNIKGIRSFLGHAGFYRRFIKDFSKIARLLTKLLEKHTPFEFNDGCHNAFKLLKQKLTCALVIEEPYLFKEYSDSMIRRCVSEPET
ncbi:hypothetical protein Tco_0445910 [Tanacetum coccineum]